MVVSYRLRWLALALLSVVQFMVVLDLAIVNVALPSIQVDLGFSQADLQWVISAYALALGGFLLLGGRAADLLGRRRAFLAGLLVFALGSLLAGLAWSEASLVGARALQGLGGAAITPAALSILSSTFVEGRERNIALSVWGAVGGLGAAAGLLTGGVLVDTLGWEWIFFLNLPVAAAALAVTPRLLRESRDRHASSFDAPGAILVTAGLSALVYAITKAGQDGWFARSTVAFLAAASAVLAGFVAWELRHPEPLVRLGILRRSTVRSANVVSLLLTTTTLSTFLTLTLYMQQVLGYSALRTGFAFVAIAGTATVWSTVAGQLVTRVGAKPVLVGGFASLASGLAYLTRMPVDGSYASDLLPAFLLIALGVGFSSVPLSIEALAGVEPAEAGLASGLITTSQQIGGALGIAALATISTARTEHELAAGAPRASALVSGFHAGLAAAVLVALLGLVASLALIRRTAPDGHVAQRRLAEPALGPAA